MTVLTEFITQVLDRKDVETIKGTMTVIHQQLVQYPQIIYTLAMQSLYFLTAILDIECCDFAKDLRLTLDIPRAIISDKCDPMKSADFRHQEDKTIMQDKINQYNTLVNNLPAWDIIEGLNDKLKYTKLQINQEERQKQFEEVNALIEKQEKIEANSDKK